MKEKYEASKVMLGYIQDQETGKQYHFVNEPVNITFLNRMIEDQQIVTVFAKIDLSFLKHLMDKPISLILVNTSDPTNCKADTVISLNQHAVAHMMKNTRIDSLNPLTVSCRIDNYNIKINRPLRCACSTLKDSRWMKK